MGHYFSFFPETGRKVNPKELIVCPGCLPVFLILQNSTHISVVVTAGSPLVLYKGNFELYGFGFQELGISMTPQGQKKKEVKVIH